MLVVFCADDELDILLRADTAAGERIVLRHEAQFGTAFAEQNTALTVANFRDSATGCCPDDAFEPDDACGAGLALGLLALGLAVGGAAGWLLTRRDATSGGPAGGATGPRRYAITLPEAAPIAPPSAHPFGLVRPTFDLAPDGSRLVFLSDRSGAADWRVLGYR